MVVADARPQLEGRRLLRQLLSAGISCEYIYLNALSFMLDKVTKVRGGLDIARNATKEDAM